MKGRQKGRPTKWVRANVIEPLRIGRRGITFEVWNKWKKTRRKLGTLTVSVGGLRWWPHKGQKYRQQTWNAVADWFEAE
jgi:hypothetical protein